MHEVDVMMQALQLAEKAARDNGAKAIHHLVLRVGDQSGIDPVSLRFAFDIVAEDTMAKSATFEIETVVGTALELAKLEVSD